MTHIPYMSKKTNEGKIAVRTERITKTESIKSIQEKLFATRAKYLCNRYLAINDKFEWKKILSTVILHMDYSENISGTSREECQDAHFAKRQYSLHCTVLHDVDKKMETVW